MNPGMQTPEGRLNKSKAARDRNPEGNLLLFAGIYLLAGAMVLYLAPDGGSSRQALPAGLAVIAAFFMVHFFWQRKGYRGDTFLLPAVAVLSATGLVFLFRLDPAYGQRQFIWLLISILALVLTTRFLLDLRFLSDYKYLYALAGIIALILPIFFGTEQGGAKSWLDFGVFHLQPSEFVKILLVLFLASYLAENRALLTAGRRIFGGIALPGPQEWIPLVTMWGISLLLLVFQRDLGTALIYFCTFLAMIYVATSRILYTFLGLVLFMAGATISYYLFSHVRTRIEIWLDPWSSIDTAGYQVTQSLFAIGSGGMFGTGLGMGHPNFIPAVHTDIIFSALCEELGLAGGAGIIVLFIIIIYRGLKTALRARDDFAVLAASGLTSLMGLQTFIILAGATKLLPLTGVTLPFISYGGSSLVANFVLLGLLLNISNEVQNSP
ncbi:MAG: Lipid II flippase FtsW [Firmicutes bacterium ADurb.Bin456]|nr:MAG: Lipid II flippase FtsW [Firmicutes bacterium ADurb.Bin456]